MSRQIRKQAAARALTGAGKTNVKAPVDAPDDTNTKLIEGKPPFTGEPLAGDGWTRAREKAKTLAPSAK